MLKRRAKIGSKQAEPALRLVESRLAPFAICLAGKLAHLANGALSYADTWSHRVFPLCVFGIGHLLNWLALTGPFQLIPSIGFSPLFNYGGGQANIKPVSAGVRVHFDEVRYTIVGGVGQ